MFEYKKDKYITNNILIVLQKNKIKIIIKNVTFKKIFFLKY